MSRYFGNGQYDISRLVIVTNTSNKVEIDIHSVMRDMTIYESIYSDTISGNVSIVDCENTIREHMLGNKETIEIHYNTSGNDVIKKVKCVVYKVSEPFKMSDHSSAHTLYFASEEAFNSIRNKTFEGYREEISSTIQALYDRMKRDVDPKPINIRRTANIEHHVFTGNELIDAIGMLAEKAVSIDNKCGYVFYEDSDSFNFLPLEEMYGQEPVVEFKYKASGVFDDVKDMAEESFCAYQDFEILKGNNFSQRMIDGFYGSSWMYFAINDKRIQTLNYDYQYDYLPYNSMTKSPVPIELEINAEHSDKYAIKYSLQTEGNYDAILRNKMLMIRANNFAVSIGVFGNSELKVGNVVKANIPNWSTNGMQPASPDRDVLTGKFLIAEIKHVFNQKLYTQRIKLIKDGFEEVTK